MALTLDSKNSGCIVGVSTFKVTFLRSPAALRAVRNSPTFNDGRNAEFRERITLPERLTRGNLRVGALDLKLIMLHAGKAGALLPPPVCR